MQLNKYLAHAGLCSRRKAVELITSGHIRVNGEPVIHPGYRVSDHDRVAYGRRRVQMERPTYILVNKPKGCVTTRHDERGRTTVLDYVSHEPPLPRVYPVGRLDYNSTGLLVVTNDGELAYALQHPSYHVPKRYHVTLHKELRDEDRRRIERGIRLEDGYAYVDRIDVSPYSSRDIRIELHSGRKRIIRRIFYALGYRVEKLDRPWYAGLSKKGLARGSWRFLASDEIEQLRQVAQTAKGRHHGRSHRNHNTQK